MSSSRPRRKFAWVGSLTLPPLILLGLSACAANRPTEGPGRHIESGTASWYGPGFHGKRTANGEVYDMHGVTAAHKTLPFGTVVEVHNRTNDRRLRVRINDRGPFIRGRIIDLSRGAAKKLGILGPGTARVDLYLVSGTVDSLHTVQVGAFRRRANADALLRRLKKAGFQEVRVRDQEGWYRVQVGAFGERRPAEILRRDLLDRGFVGTVRALPATP